MTADRDTLAATRNILASLGSAWDHEKAKATRELDALLASAAAAEQELRREQHAYKFARRGDTAVSHHERDYIERTIATVRNHRDAENCWPQWANIFADEIEASWARVAALEAAIGDCDGTCGFALAAGSAAAEETPRAWRVYCGAHTSVSLVSDGDQGECGTEFIFVDDDPVYPSEWVPCPKCGAECEVDRSVAAEETQP